jgi:cytochrome d ubiquinol oxidase subunit II
VFIAFVTVATFSIQPQVSERMNGNPAGYLLPLGALAGTVFSRISTGKGKELPAFLGSTAFLLGMLLAVVFSLYPMVLPAAGDPSASLTIYNASGPPYALRVALYWWVPGMILVTGYTTFMYRQMAGKVKLDQEGY